MKNNEIIPRLFNTLLDLYTKNKTEIVLQFETEADAKQFVVTVKENIDYIEGLG